MTVKQCSCAAAGKLGRSWVKKLPSEDDAAAAILMRSCESVMALTHAMNLLGSGVSSSFFKRATAVLSFSLAALDQGSCGREEGGGDGGSTKQRREVGRKIMRNSQKARENENEHQN